MPDLRRAIASATLAASLFGIGLMAEPAWAGCNQIPSTTVQTWRGFRGTLDTVFGRPDAAPLTTTDPRDVWVGSNSCTPTELADEDYVVTVIFKPARVGKPNIVALTTAMNCSALSCDNGSNFFCVPDPKSGIVVPPNSDTLRFRFPDTDEFFLPAGDGEPFTGPALIAVTPSSEPLPCKLANQRCQDPGGPAKAFACVDEIFDVGSCGTGRADLDPTFAHFTALPPMNDWQKICAKSAGDPLPECTNKKPTVLFTVDKGGNVAMPVSWAQVLADEVGIPGKKKNRKVEGRTDLFKNKGGNKKIKIPRNGFLGSFTPKGGGWPSKPIFEADSQGPWLVLRGESDVPESVLRISRRELWEYECNGGSHVGQACEPNAEGECPGDGAVCVQRPQPAYFACENGAEAGSYCTRSSDCPGGKCTPGSACVAISGQPPSPPPPPKSSPPCYTDLSCNDDEECGLGLFEFRDRLERLSGSQQGVGPVVIPKARYKAKAGKY